MQPPLGQQGTTSPGGRRRPGTPGGGSGAASPAPPTTTTFGRAIDHGSPANFVPVNTADNWLHLFPAAGMIARGVLLGRDTRGRTAL